MRWLAVLFLMALLTGSIVFPAPASGQGPSRSEIEAHLREIYKGYGHKLEIWKQPVRYSVVGLKRQETKQIVDRQFAYLRDLTGLEIKEADPTDPNRNFILVFASPMAGIADIEVLRPIFGKEGQSDAEYRESLEELDRDELQLRSFGVDHSGSLAFFAVLADPTEWKSNQITVRFLQLIVQGLTQATGSDRIRPSIFNTYEVLRPASRLPSVDEAYLKILYGGTFASGMPIDEVLPNLASAVASELGG